MLAKVSTEVLEKPTYAHHFCSHNANGKHNICMAAQQYLSGGARDTCLPKTCKTFATKNKKPPLQGRRYLEGYVVPRAIKASINNHINNLEAIAVTAASSY